MGANVFLIDILIVSREVRSGSLIGSISRLSNSTVVPVQDEYHQFLPEDEDVEFALSCPSAR